MPEPSPSAAESRHWLAFAACSLIWGSTFLVIRIGNDSLPPFWAATLRLAFALVALLLLARLRGEKLPRGAAARAAAGYGFFNFGLSFCLLYWGEKSVPSGLTSVVYATIPLSTALFARLFGLEPLARHKVAGALVAIAGVAFIFANQLAGRIPPLALAAIVLAATCASFSGILLKRGPSQSPLGANAVGAMAGVLVCGAASVLAREPRALPATPGAWGAVLYLTLMGSVGAFVLYAWLVQRWPVSRLSFISVIVPLVALALGAAVRGERVTGTAVAGSLLVLAGLAIAIAGDVRRAAPAR